MMKADTHRSNNIVVLYFYRRFLTHPFTPSWIYKYDDRSSCDPHLEPHSGLWSTELLLAPGFSPANQINLAWQTTRPQVLACSPCCSTQVCPQPRSCMQIGNYVMPLRQAQSSNSGLLFGVQFTLMQNKYFFKVLRWDWCHIWNTGHWFCWSHGVISKVVFLLWYSTLHFSSSYAFKEQLTCVSILFHVRLYCIIEWWPCPQPRSSDFFSILTSLSLQFNLFSVPAQFLCGPWGQFPLKYIFYSAQWCHK